MRAIKRFLSIGNGALAVAAAMAVFVAAVLAWNAANPIDYLIYTVKGTSYAKGVVEKIESSTVAWDDSVDRNLGTQKLVVLITSGDHAGEEVEVTNDLSATHNIEASEGMAAVVKVDDPRESVQPFYSVFNYDRTVPIAAILGLFAVIMGAVGGVKGLKSLVGLAFSLFTIMEFLLPAIYHGGSPILMGCLAALIITVLNMVLLNGISRKTFAAMTSTMAGVLVAVVLYLVFSGAMRLSGYNLDEAEELLAIHTGTGLDVGQIMFVGVVISALGAVMDMCMSVASSLFEMARLRDGIDGRQIVRSGMTIGRDMIGTMCMTLILAFAGTAIAALLVMVAYGAQLDTLLASDFVATELLQSFIGGMAVVLSVPITAVVSSFAICGLPQGREEEPSAAAR
ncbi:MAG: YibE/F family protein [Coriobacteriia bacterium]|nr:YibE/F family protein [Coriobacteriia bacterium]